MKIIAIDSSGMAASAAIMTEQTMIAEYTVNYKKTHSQTLLPMIDEIVKMSELKLEEIDAIAVAEGPGSFTGLRIGAATAKGLGLALEKPLVGVPTADAIAYNLFGTGNAVICPLMDARREEVYSGLYEFIGYKREISDSPESDGFHVITNQRALPIADVIEEINTIKRPVIYLGDGVSAYKDIIEKQTKVEYGFAPAHLAEQRAGAVGMLAFEYLRRGKTTTAAEHIPTYLRVSQAERELNLKNVDNDNT